MKRFLNKRALVTGAASGIGRAIAQRLAEEGAAVALVDLADPSPAAQAIRDQVVEANITSFQIDVSDFHAIETLFKQIEANFGQLDVLVNSAGIISRASLHDQDPLEWQHILNVNVNAMFYTARFAAPLMARAGGGAIVNIASLAASYGGTNVAYAASKGGVVSLSRHLAHELASDNIRVNSISPGPVQSGMNTQMRGSALEQQRLRLIPLGRYGTAQEIAAGCAFLAADEGSYITGIDLVIDGGLSSGQMALSSASK
jgi:meso-butanediol dehydrogenase/(S,S)-butanediol dehydrogenase/diacetyl reductase